jgi:hypothetical protein
MINAYLGSGSKLYFFKNQMQVAIQIGVMYGLCRLCVTETLTCFNIMRPSSGDATY